MYAAQEISKIDAEIVEKGHSYYRWDSVANASDARREGFGK